MATKDCGVYTNAVIREKIDELLTFLPVFDSPSYMPFIIPYEPPEKEGTSHYPIYNSDVENFFFMAGQPFWSDYNYQPRNAARMLNDDKFIAGCSIEDIKTMLTCCVRSERFGDGSWGAMIESGRITALLRRLNDLRQTLEEGNT